MKKESIFTPTFIINTLISFLFYIVFYVLTSSIGTYALVQLHQSTVISLSLSSIFVIGALIGHVWTGLSITKLGMKKLLYIGGIIFLVLTFGYYLTTNIPLLFLIRIIQGAGFGIGATASGTIAGHVVPARRRGEGIGYYALSVTLAAAVGPALSIMIYSDFGFNVLLGIALALLALTFVLIFFVHVKELSEAERIHALQNQPQGLNRYIEKSALPISIVAFLAGFIDSAILTGMGTFSTDLKIPLAGSLFFTMYAIFIFLSRPFTGRIFDTKGDNWVWHPTFFFFAVAMLLVGIAGFFTPATAFMILLVAGSAFGLGYGGVAPFGQAVAIRDSNKERIGVATSTFFGFLDLGVGGGPIILGALIPMLGHGMKGFQNLYLYSAPAVLIVWVIYYLIHGKKQNKRA
ncbi:MULTISPECIES: MFS transporter [unclassified Lactococcus]|uniref:MFS transporter n=1 Tax=unclassified Lactococcus TaxID=2643510 RepID=UPI0011C9009E|nr:MULTISPECIES: MFS transporter [unclassified Lactococcus]MQW22138.1 MFS transporter [Lactococcus sp. dk101]TXK45074.1 MFS transporter [Lactococcus sp. dk310]TXK51146.1 MFS transporter [Lactococcus sp. dk322]